MNVRTRVGVNLGIPNNRDCGDLGRIPNSKIPDLNKIFGTNPEIYLNILLDTIYILNKINLVETERCFSSAGFFCNKVQSSLNFEIINNR